MPKTKSNPASAKEAGWLVRSACWYQKGLSYIDAKILGHRLGDVRYADEIFLDDLAGTGAVRDGALREAQQIERCDGIVLLIEADLAQRLEDAVEIDVEHWRSRLVNERTCAPARGLRG